MEKLLMVVVILFAFILILLLGVIGFLFFYLYKQNKNNNKDEVKTSKKVKNKNPNSNEDERKNIQGLCFNHPEQNAQGTCAICENSFCEKCLWEHEKTLFCPEHYRVFMDSKWVELMQIQSTPDKPESALALYDLKAQAWEKKIPTYIVTHYKINLDGDQIESHVTLFGRDQDAEKLKDQLK